MTINERVHTVREALGLKQADFGKPLHLTQMAVSMIESGERRVTDRVAEAVCNYWKVNRSWLLDGEGEIFSRMPSLAVRLCGDVPEGCSLEDAVIASFWELDGPARKVFLSICDGKP